MKKFMLGLILVSLTRPLFADTSAPEPVIRTPQGEVKAKPASALPASARKKPRKPVPPPTGPVTPATTPIK